MSVAEQITRLNTAKADIKTAIESHSITVPSDAHIDTYDDYIKQIGDSTYWTHDWKFKRPADWPNLDVFDIDNTTNTIVASFDCRARIANEEVKDYFACQCNQSSFVVERGVITNGQFVINATYNGSSLPRINGTSGNYYLLELLPRNEGDYVVYRMRGTTNGLIYVYFGVGNSTYNSNFSMGGEKGWTTKAMEVHCNWKGIYFFPIVRSPLLRHYKIITGNYGNYNTGNIHMKWCTALEYIDTSKWQNAILKNLYEAFAACSNLKKIDLTNIPISSSATDYRYAFYRCVSLESLDLSMWDTQNATNMGYMFATCSNLKSLDVSTWNTAKVTSMYQMFYSVSSLEELDISSFNTAKVTDLRQMFAYARSLKSVVLGSGFSTEACTSMDSVFRDTDSLSINPLSGMTLDTSKVTTFTNMFVNCYTLKEMDMSGWDFTKVTATSGTSTMFQNCYHLQKVVLPSTVAIMNANIFDYCYNLETIIVNATTPPTWAVTTTYLGRLYSNYKIYVPDASVNSYKSASGWTNASSHIFSINDLT